MMMAKSIFCLVFILCTALAASSNQDDTSQRSRDDHKLSSMLFRQAQDMAVMMADIKILIMLQEQPYDAMDQMEQQQRDMMDKVERQQRDMMDKVEQQQRDMMDKVEQQQRDMMDKVEQQQRDMMDKVEQQQRDMIDKVEQQQRDMIDKVEQQLQDTIDKMKQQQSEMMDGMEEQNNCTDVDEPLVEQEITKHGCDGIFANKTTLYIKGSPVAVPCDDAGWLIMLRRIDNQYNFSTNGWEAYKHPFGDPNGSFWLGLEYIHFYTNSLGSAKLRLDLKDFYGVTEWAEYTTFHILGESDEYQLMVSGKTGNASGYLSNDSGMKFTTNDKDNTPSSENCAEDTGRWFKDCDQATLAGEYGQNGIYWGSYLKKVEMKIRLE